MNKRTILLLLLVTAATCAVIFHRYLFGHEILAFEDIGSDTSQQYLMQYASIIGKIRRGDFSLWNAAYGFGANMYMLNLFNPCLMVLYLIGALFGFEVIPGLMVWWFVAEILAAAFCGYLYLSVFKLPEPAKAAAAYMYAFNGFMIVWGQHYQFGVACILVPLLLWAAERVLRDRSRWPSLVIISAVITLNSMYIAYMIFMMAAFYVIFRLLMSGKKPLGTFILEGLTCAWPMILGLAIGAVNLLPSYAAISNVSSRLNSDLSLLGRLSGAFHPYPPDYYKTLLDRLLAGTGEGINVFMGYLNYYEAPCVFFSGLFVILLLHYVVRLPFRRESRRLKILQAVFLLLAAAGLFFPAAGVILNGMTAPFSRYTFLYMPYFMLIAAFSLKDIHREKKVSLIAAAAGALFMIWRYRIMILSPWHNPKKVLICLLISGLLMTAVLAVVRFVRSHKVREALFVLTAVILVGNAALEGYGNFSDRESLEKDDAYFETLYDADTLAALQKIKSEDSDVYRIEKLYGATYCMDALYQDYRPVSVYNSTQNRNVIDFVDTDWPELYYRDQNHYDFVLGAERTDMASLVGVRYILALGDAALPGYTLIDEVGEVKIYKNDVSPSLSTYFDEESYVNQNDEVTCSFEDRDTEAIVTFKEDDSDGVICGAVSSKEPGFLMVTLPFEDGWHAYVDGTEVEILKADLAFQGIKLDKGSHEVLFQYECPLFKIGLIITLAGIGLFAALLWLGGTRGRSRY